MLANSCALLLFDPKPAGQFGVIVRDAMEKPKFHTGTGLARPLGSPPAARHKKSTFKFGRRKHSSSARDFL